MTVQLHELALHFISHVIKNRKEPHSLQIKKCPFLMHAYTFSDPLFQQAF